MDALDAIVASVTDQRITCDVYRDDSTSAYGGDPSKVGTVDVAIFEPSSSSEVVVEGSGQDTSLTGLVVPTHDSNGDLVHDVEVNDELRVQSNEAKRYDVRVKDGVPNELDPDMWRLGLERANASS